MKRDRRRFGRTRHYYKYKKPIYDYTRNWAIIGVVCVAALCSVFGAGYTLKAKQSIALYADRLLQMATNSIKISSVEADTSQLMSAKLQQAIEESSGLGPLEISASIYDIRSDAWLLNVNDESPMTAASLYKLYVVYGLSKKLPFESWDSEKVGGQTVKSCVDLMLRVSDNLCGVKLGDYVGWAELNKLVKGRGFSSTTLNGQTDLQVATSSKDTTLFMRDLYNGKLLDEPTTGFVLGSLRKQRHVSGIPAGCKDCEVWNKTGEAYGFVHDSAIVKSGERTYVVTIMTKGGSMESIASLQRKIEEVL